HYCLVVTLIMVLCYYFFFFFQAEDGIRDFHVTGVQTCALPIYRRYGRSASRRGASARCWCMRRCRPTVPPIRSARSAANSTPIRSGERRVGEEGKSRRSTDKYKKKK